MPPVSYSAPLQAESMQCAEDRLRAANYDVGWDGDVLEGEILIMAGDEAVGREFIRVSAGTTNELQASVTAYSLEAAAHATVTRPLNAVPTDPSPATLTIAEQLVQACGG
jgi:hypothetical protein